MQVCDSFGNFRIDTPQTEAVKKPLLIFCCSELTRTHQTLFLSWLKYLKDYKENNGKIIVLPWLNEVAVRKLVGYVFNKDNRHCFKALTLLIISELKEYTSR